MEGPEADDEPADGWLESHPRLSAPEVADSLACGLTRCEWTWQGEDRPFGYVEVRRVSDDQLTITRVLFMSDAPHERTPQLVRVTQTNKYTDNRLFSEFLCPVCAKRRRDLVFRKGAWKCRVCCGLLYRSQAIDSRILKWERLEELKRFVERGRPKGMHHATFAKIVEELETLRNTLTGPRLTAPREYGLAFTTNWVRTPEDK